MFKAKMVRKNTTEVVDLMCDKCDKSCKKFFDKEKKHFNFEHAKVVYSFGYGSNLDGAHGEIHLCEECFVKLANSCKVKLEL